INVVHAEDASSNSVSKNIREKKLFILKNSTNSLKKLKKLIKSMGD
ncbi:glycosyl transferase, partial [Enterococcus faecium]